MDRSHQSNGSCWRHWKHWKEENEGKTRMRRGTRRKIMRRGTREENNEEKDKGGE